MNLITPLTIGLVGSLHCIGMCGPIALALPLKGKSNIQRTFGLLLYNSGRILTYALFGTLFGLLGKSFHLAGLQRQVSVFLGALIIFYGIPCCCCLLRHLLNADYNLSHLPSFVNVY